MVCDRWWLIKLYVKDGVCDKVVCGGGGRRRGGGDPGCRIKNKNPTQKCGEQEPHTTTRIDVTKCHACHAPSAISAPPATQNEDGCAQAPRLPRKTKVDVKVRHACHAKCGQASRLPRKVPRRHRRQKNRPKRATQCHNCHACHAKRPWM